MIEKKKICFLNDEDVKVVHSLDVIAGAHLRHNQRVQEPSQIYLNIRLFHIDHTSSDDCTVD